MPLHEVINTPADDRRRPIKTLEQLPPARQRVELRFAVRLVRVGLGVVRIRVMKRVMLVRPQHVVVEKRREQHDRQNSIEDRIAHDALVRGVVRKGKHPPQRHAGEQAATDLGPPRRDEKHAGDRSRVHCNVEHEQRQAARRLRRRKDVELADQLASSRQMHCLAQIRIC